MTKDEWLKLWGFTPETPEAEQAWGDKLALDERASGSFYVVRDIGEYTSPVDGTRITSRSAHRDHIRRHDLIEIGNEKVGASAHKQSTGSAGRDIKNALERARQMPEGQYRDRMARQMRDHA